MFGKSAQKIKAQSYRIEELERRVEFLENELATEYSTAGNYTSKPGEYLDEEDIMTLDYFLNEFPYGGPYDGTAYPMKDGLEDTQRPFNKGCLWRIPKDATHVAWYNR